MSENWQKYVKPFEDSVGATLALDLTRREKPWEGFYQSPKTSNLFIAFVYGWWHGGGDARSMAAYREEVANAMAALARER